MQYEAQYSSAQAYATQLADQAANSAFDNPERAVAFAEAAQAYATLALAAATMATQDRG